MVNTLMPFLGYLASLLLIIALLVGNDIKFRWYSLLGNICFIIYAMFLESVPVLLTNTILLSINVYFLIRIYNRKELFDLIEFKGEEKLVTKFLEMYRADIQKYFPEFKVSDMQGNLNFVVTRNLVIANLFSARVLDNGDAEVVLNYTLEKYRDFKVGRFIFEQENDYLFQHSVRRIVYRIPVHKKHTRFLKVMGFKETMIDGQLLLAKDVMI